MTTKPPRVRVDLSDRYEPAVRLYAYRNRCSLAAATAEMLAVAISHMAPEYGEAVRKSQDGPDSLREAG